MYMSYLLFPTARGLWPKQSAACVTDNPKLVSSSGSSRNLNAAVTVIETNESDWHVLTSTDF